METLVGDIPLNKVNRPLITASTAAAPTMARYSVTRDFPVRIILERVPGACHDLLAFCDILFHSMGEWRP